MINVRLLLFIELYPFIPLSETLIIFQGHGSEKKKKERKKERKFMLDLIQIS